MADRLCHRVRSKGSALALGYPYPAATPGSIVSEVGKHIAEIVEANEMKVRFEAQGVNLVSSTPQAFDSILRSDAERFGRLY